jgi:hypothetical protein
MAGAHDSDEIPTKVKVAKEKPCRAYEKDGDCSDGRDHCYECARHLDPETQKCPKGCE